MANGTIKMYAEFEEVLTKAIEDNIPMKRVGGGSRGIVNKNVLYWIKKKRKAYNLWMNDKSNSILKEYFKSTSKEVKKACRDAKSKKEKILAEGKNWQGLFSYINRCRGSRDKVGPLKELVCGRVCGGSNCNDECKKRNNNF